MSTTTAAPRDGHLLGRSASEYERLRGQARVWEFATGRLLDRVGLAPGARCLDAGCGPGETMRLIAQRVGPDGAVLGIDIDEPIGTQALVAVHAAGHDRCASARVDVTAADDPIPGSPFELVFARLLLMHLPDPVAALRRLWDAVAPGGHLIVQDFDLRPVGVTPHLDTVTHFRDVVLGTFAAAGRHEIEHLVAQAETYAFEADELLDRIELAAGACAIDVGCGALGLLPQRRARVGPRGRVVGLDLEPAMLAPAARRGAETETVHADAAATGLPVHARAGNDFHLGRCTARLLRQAGLRDVHARAAARVTRPAAYFHTIRLALCRLLRPQLLADGALEAGWIVLADGRRGAATQLVDLARTSAAPPLDTATGTVKSATETVTASRVTRPGVIDIDLER